jgi:hypothetical protein
VDVVSCANRPRTRAGGRSKKGLDRWAICLKGGTFSLS